MTFVPSGAEDTCLKNQARPNSGTYGSAASLPVHVEWGSEKETTGSPSSSSGSLFRDANTTERAQKSRDEVSFPEGGTQAWLVVLGSFCAMFCIFGIINTSAVFESWFSTHQLSSYTPSQIGWIFSLYLFVVFFVGIQVGPVFDQYGPHVLVAVGSVLMVASLMLLGFCTSYYQILLCYSVLGGLGGALLNTPSYGCVAHFFNARRGLATGIATTAGGIGGILFPLLLQQLLPRIGFAWSTRVLGSVLLVLAIPANIFLRARMELLQAGGRRDNRGRGRRARSVWPDFTIFRDARYAVATAGIFFMEWGLFVPITFLVSFAAEHGQGESNGYTLLALLNAGSTVGRFAPGLVADRVGRFNVIIVTILLSALSVLGLWLPAGRSEAMVTVFAVVFGIASGSNLGLVAVCLGQLCEPGDYGRFFSTAMMVASFGTLSSVPVAGAIVGIGGSTGWAALIMFSGVSYMVALGCYLAARVMAVGWRLGTVF